MRAAIIADLGNYGTIENAAIWDRVSRYGLQRLYVDERQMTAGMVDAIHKHGIQAGIWLVPGWFGAPSPQQFAQIASDAITRLLASSKQLAVLFDVETHDTQWISDFVDAWRALRPTRATEETFEPFQGGVEPYLKFEAANIAVEPQLYYGNMAPVAADRVVIDMVGAGADPSEIHAVYDSRKPLGDRWDGTLFDLEHAP